MNIVAPAGNYEKLEAAIKAGANDLEPEEIMRI